MNRQILFQATAGGVTAAARKALAAVLSPDDELVLCPADEQIAHPCEADDIANLYAELRAHGVRVKLARRFSEAAEHLCRSWQSGDHTLYLHGDQVVVDTTKNPVCHWTSCLPDPRQIWIGQGSNTWRSDLNLDIRYRRTMGPADAPGASLGIPWMVGIPGTIGGWIKMNAGAFGHSISEALEAVCVDGVWRAAADCGFAYRHSDLHGEIQDFRMRPREQIKTEGDAAFYLAKRRKFPAHTFGSFFKNPPSDYAGRLLEEVDAKAMRVGGATVWQEHANVVIAGEKATPSDVLALARQMMVRVKARFGIWLEPEVCGISIDNECSDRNVAAP